MEKNLAKLLSIIFHPLLFPTIGILVLLNSGTVLEYLPFQAKKVIFLIVLVSTFVLPLTFVPFFIFQKIIKDVQMDNHRERLIPLFVTSILYFFSYYLLIRLGAPITISKFILTAGISVFALFLFTIKWKISAHMIGIGGLTGAIIAFSFMLNVNLEIFIIISIVLSGLLGYSRLKLSSHKQFEIYTGWITGFTLSFIILLFF